MAERLAGACSRELRVLDLSAPVPLDAQKPLLAERPDVVVTRDAAQSRGAARAPRQPRPGPP